MVRNRFFNIPGIDAFLPERLFQVLGKGSLYQPVFTVDVGDHGHLFGNAWKRNSELLRILLTGNHIIGIQ